MNPFSCNMEEELPLEIVMEEGVPSAIENFPSRTYIRSIMLYEFHKGQNAANATKNIQSIYGEVVDRRTCQRWFQRFQCGNYDLNDEPRSGRPKNLDDESLLKEVERNCEVSTHQLSKKLNTSSTSVLKHLKKMGKVWKDGRWVNYNSSNPQDQIPAEKPKRETAKKKSLSKLNKLFRLRR